MYEWVVIGAGPAGIAAVGKLIDRGVPAASIHWIDPHFKVGDLGTKWNQVPSNTAVALFLRYLNDCNAFRFKERPSQFLIETLDPKQNCLLQDIAEPLQWITDSLRKKISSTEAMAIGLHLTQGRWEIKTTKESILGKKVILAIGSDPKPPNFTGPENIPMEVALNPKKLNEVIQPQDTVGVFGSSHSAILVLANLLECNLKGVVNFYRSPHRYALFLQDWILYDDTGLKGFAANWAREHLDKNTPKKLKRILASDRAAFEEAFGQCNKAVYATGFQRRTLPALEQYENLRYDEQTGIIAPNLFGFGIAFPQVQFNRLGMIEHRVGLWKFMDYLNTILPIWLMY